MFRLAPEFDETIIELPNGHREYRVKCRLIHIPTGNLVGTAAATCSTMEAKYRYRGGARKCPQCGKEAIKKSKFPPRDKPNAQPGYYCFAKVGGCGANFDADDQDIIGQSETKSENPDLADTYNTVQQIAQKRALLAATKTATGASNLFTQDMEDHVQPGEHEHDMPDDRRPVQKRDQAAARDQSRQHASGEESQVPKQEPAPLSPEFTNLRDTLYSMGVPAGNLEHANAVIRYGYEGATIQKCAKDSELAQKTLDGLMNRAANVPAEQVYQDAMKAAGLLVEAGAESIPY
jgi:hypothetical protein